MSQNEFLKYIDSPEFKELLNRYESALSSGELGFFDADDLIDLAEYYHIDGELEDALNAAEYCLKLYPGDSSALLFLARIQLIDFNSLEGARKYFSQVQESDDNIEAFYVKAEIMMLEGKVEQADIYLEERYEAILKHQEEDAYDNEEDEEEDNLNFPLDVAMLFMDHGYCDISEKWIGKAKAQHQGQEIDILDTKARIYFAQERLTESIDVLNKLLDIDAYNVNAWMQLCDAQFHTSEFNDALQSAEYALAIAPDLPEAYMAKGNCHYALNQLEEARECFAHYTELYPEDAIGELLLATVLFCQNKAEEAYDHIMNVQKNITQLPDLNQKEALRISASIASKLGYKEEAMMYCEQLEALGISSKETELIKGTICLDDNDFESAMRHFINAVEQGETDFTVVTRVCLILYEYGIFFATYKLLTSFVQTYTEDLYEALPPETFAILAATCKQMGKEKEYLRYLEFAVRFSPLDASSLLGEFFPAGTEPADYLRLARSGSNE